MPNVTEYLDQRNDSEFQAIVVDMLNKTPCQFSFHKADGSVRTMRATLDHTVVPAVEKARAPNPSILTVYDVEAEGWRTIVWDRLITFKIG